MPDPVQDVNVEVKKETTELLTNRGDTLSREGPLADIFRKAEEGTPIDQAVKEVMDNPVKQPDKKEEVVVKQEPKEEASDLSKKLDQQQSKKDEEVKQELSLREQMLKETEQKKEEAKKEDKPVHDPDAVTDDELQVLQSDKPKTAKRIQALLKKIDAVNEIVTSTRRESDEKAAKLKELENKLSEVKTVDPKVAEEIQKQKDELAMYRRRYDLDKDPEVKSRFDDRIIASEKPVKDILVRNGASDALVKIIEDEGGWLKFTQSYRPIQTADGSKPASEVADIILQSLPFADKRAVEAIATEQIATKREKERYYEDQIRTANDFFKNQEEQSRQAAKQYQEQVDQARKMIEDFVTNGSKKHKYLQETEVPSDATPEQKAAIEESNKYTKQLNALRKKFVETKDVSGMLEVVEDAVSFYQERRVHAQTASALAAKEKEIARLNEEIAKYKNARTVPKAGSIAGGGSSSSTPSKPEKPKSLEAALDLISAGQSLDGSSDE